MKRPLFAAAACAAILLMGQTAVASECKVDVEDPFDLDEAAIAEIYNCISASMAEGYAAEGDAVGTAYRTWTVSSTRPAVAGGA